MEKENSQSITLSLIKDEMKKIKLTQKALAEELSIDRTTVGNWFTGKRQMPLNRYLEILKLLELEEFIPGVKEEKEPIEIDIWKLIKNNI
jgi:transcriptional regulator with XRE-family HTH domain